MTHVGDRLGAYEVGECIGEGGTSQVHRARHLTLGTLHALKILRIPRPTDRTRLLEEARALAMVRHPNILALQDIIEAEGQLALVLELISGPTLQDWRLTNPPYRERMRVFREIVTAVRELHRYGYVHRDVKPENILMAEVGGTVIPKLGDLGIAKVPGSPQYTLTGVAMGTPWYMAPEQIRDAGSVDHRADLFALGVILYELVADIGPYGATGFGTRYDAAPPLVPLLERVPSVDPSVAALTDRLLSQRRQDRPASADEVIRALDGWRTTLPSTGSRPAPRPARRSTHLLGFALVGCGMGLGLGWWGVPSLAQDQPVAPPAECVVEIAAPAFSPPPDPVEAPRAAPLRAVSKDDRDTRGRRGLFKRKPRP